MRVIPPITGASTLLLDAMLTSSSVAEPAAGETVWSAATAYSVGQEAIRVGTHRKYARLVAGTTAALPENDPLNWFDVGATLRWAMFDTLRNTATVSASPLTVVITPGQRVDAIALMAVLADSATVSMVVGGSTVYTRTTLLNSRTVTNLYQFFFEPFTNQPSLVLFDVPPYSAGVITVTFTRASGSVACGACLVGVSQFLGDADYNALRDALNFSSVTRDVYGNATLVPRRSVPKTNQTLYVGKAEVPRLLDLQASLNAVPAVYSGLDDRSADGYFEALLILGIYKQFGINLAYPKKAKVTLELEEI